MDFFKKLERKYYKYAIRNLMYYIIILYAVGLAGYVMNPAGFFRVYIRYLSLDAAAILHGQIWRIVTFMVYPPALGSWQFDTIFMGIISLFLYHNLGRTLESIWGSFRFNVFFFMGIVGQVLACLAVYLITGRTELFTTGYINLSLFLAFCICFPDAQFLLFFVIPVKARWLAVADGCLYLYSFLFGSLSTRLVILFSLANVIVFFLMTRNYQRYAPKEIRRKQKFKREVKIKPQGATRHKCAVCGRTELDGEDLEFRYCSKCQGSYEYCMDHLYTHRHVTGEGSENT
ncbi:MAG: hypothetical protein HFG64_13395 [Lachnospiraceae bacterium]|nr:hypothetical protein [Lachnospiraceae bacterium]